jgi:predicted membrane protein
MQPQTKLTQQHFMNNKKNGLIAGLFLIGIASLVLARNYGLIFLPHWIFTWQMLLITIGLFIGIKSNFSNPGWIAPMLIGIIFLTKEFFPNIVPREMIIPLVLFTVGFWLIFKPKRKHYYKKNWTMGQETQYTQYGAEPTTETNTTNTTINRIEENVVFGGTRKSFVVKNLNKGEISAVFGSAEINLLQSDISEKAVLEISAVFGSVRLIIPSHWNVIIEASAVLGGIDDYRPKHTIYSDKTLIIKGAAVFGGIEIASN